MSWQTIVKENNLEVAVIDTKQLFVDNPNTRIDSDFFRRSYLQDDGGSTKERVVISW